MHSNIYLFHSIYDTPADRSHTIMTADDALGPHIIHVTHQDDDTRFRQFAIACLDKRIDDGHTSRIAVLGYDRESMADVIVEAVAYFRYLMTADRSYSVSYKVSDREWIALPLKDQSILYDQHSSFMFKINRDDAFKNSVQEFILFDYTKQPAESIAMDLQRNDYNLVLLDNITKDRLKEHLTVMQNILKQSVKPKSSKQIYLPPKMTSSIKLSTPTSPKNIQAKRITKTGIRSPKSGIIPGKAFRSTSPKTRLAPSLKYLESAENKKLGLKTLENVISQYSSPGRKVKNEGSVGSFDMFQAEMNSIKKETDSLNYSPRTSSNASPFIHGGFVVGSPFGKSPKRQNSNSNPVLTRLLANRETPNSLGQRKNTESNQDDPKDSWRNFNKEKTPAMIICSEVEENELSKKQVEIKNLKQEVKAKDSVCDEYKQINSKIISEMAELKQEFQKVIQEIRVPKTSMLSPKNSLAKLNNFPLSTSFGAQNSELSVKVASF